MSHQRSRRGSGSAADSGGSNSSKKSDPHSFTLMDGLIEKLKLLDYEEKFCIARNFRPLQRSFFVTQSLRSEYFTTFSALVLWLLLEMKHDFIEWTEFDDPTAIANSVLEESRLLGFSCNTKPTDLLSGSAAHTMCELLDFLASKALQCSSFSVAPAEYPKGDPADDDDIEDDIVDDEDDIDDECAGHTDDDDNVASSSSSSDGDNDGHRAVVVGAADKSLVAGAARSLSRQKKQQRGPDAASTILESKVDPRAWLIELERVEQRLKRVRVPPSTLEWRTHLTKSTTHSATLGKLFPDAKTRFDKIGRSLSESAQRISAKETHINQEFSHVASEYREKQSLLKSASDRCNSLNEEVSALAAKLETVSDEVDMTRAQMDTRNSTMTDMSPLRQIQDTLSSLRKELTQIDLRVGVTRQALLTAKSLEQKTLRNESRMSNRRKMMGGGKHKQGGLSAALRGRRRGRGGMRAGRNQRGRSRGSNSLPRSNKVTSLRAARGQNAFKQSDDNANDRQRKPLKEQNRYSGSSGRRSRNSSARKGSAKCGSHNRSKSTGSHDSFSDRSSSHNYSGRETPQDPSRDYRTQNGYTRDSGHSRSRSSGHSQHSSHAHAPEPPQTTRLDMSAVARFSSRGGGERGLETRRAMEASSSAYGSQLHNERRPETRRPGERVSRQNSVRGL